MLSKVELICFAASYGIALVLEISRLFFRAPVRVFVTQGFAILGLVMHASFIWRHSEASFAAGVPLSSWQIWWLLASWLLTAIYIGFSLSRPQTAGGVFMLPVVLALLVAARFSEEAPFERARAVSMWSLVHGMALLLGTVTTALGFVAGLMYLVQSYRLKQKLPPTPGFRLPSLEWLQAVNKQSLYYSSVLLAAGVFAGVVLNMIHKGVPWNDRVVVSSGILLAWLFAATLFELLYKPAQQGRKVAYLTVASFVFLAMVLAMLLSGSPHASSAQASAYPLPLGEGRVRAFGSNELGATGKRRGQCQCGWHDWMSQPRHVSLIDRWTFQAPSIRSSNEIIRGNAYISRSEMATSYPLPLGEGRARAAQHSWETNP